MPPALLTALLEPPEPVAEPNDSAVGTIIIELDKGEIEPLDLAAVPGVSGVVLVAANTFARRGEGGEDGNDRGGDNGEFHCVGVLGGWRWQLG